MAFSCIGLTWFESVLGTAVLLFGLGLGWNLSFVAATAQLADCARRPNGASCSASATSCPP